MVKGKGSKVTGVWFLSISSWLSRVRHSWKSLSSTPCSYCPFLQSPWAFSRNLRWHLRLVLFPSKTGCSLLLHSLRGRWILKNVLFLLASQQENRWHPQMGSSGEFKIGPFTNFQEVEKNQQGMVKHLGLLTSGVVTFPRPEGSRGGTS